MKKLAELPGDSVSSVRWSGRGGHLAVGSNTGVVTLWDATTQRELRRFKGHKKRVGVAAWAGPLLASGSKDSAIHLRDVRSKRPVEFNLEGGHKQCVGGAGKAASSRAHTAARARARRGGRLARICRARARARVFTPPPPHPAPPPQHATRPHPTPAGRCAA